VTTKWAIEAPLRLRQRVNRSIRGAIGLTKDPPTRCNDPDEAYFAVDGVARIIHADLPPMLIGGLASLFIQMLHPHTMAGVADHSRYREDPLGRLRQTADFIGFTTFGSRAEAFSSIERVLAVHQAVRGTADDGAMYFANDPHLLAWVHAAETSMFLTGYQRYGRQHLSDVQADAYVREMANLARDLGMTAPPESVAELNAAILTFRPELRLSDEGAVARDFVASGVVRGVQQKSIYWLLVRSSYGLMTPWQRELLGVDISPLRLRLLIHPAAKVLCWTMRFFVPPPPSAT
jgi:uncharacterized protein (DUF2236 family)